MGHSSFKTVMPESSSAFAIEDKAHYIVSQVCFFAVRSASPLQRILQGDKLSKNKSFLRSIAKHRRVSVSQDLREQTALISLLPHIVGYYRLTL